MNHWEKLLSQAFRLIDGAGLKTQQFIFGGGTVLMLEFDHRLSKDIDLFTSDPQYISMLSPRLNDVLEGEVEDYSEQSTFTRVRFEYGEVDFILAQNISEIAPRNRTLLEREIFVDHPVEIIAKKIKYRGDSFKVRDMYDLGVVYKYFANDLTDLSLVIPEAISILSNRIQQMQTAWETLEKEYENLSLQKSISLSETFEQCVSFLVSCENTKIKEDNKKILTEYEEDGPTP